MKIRKIYTLALALGAVVFMLGNAAGPGSSFARQVTGAPGSQGNLGTCANTGCHAGGSFAPTLTIELLDGTTVVDKYEPDKSYTVRIVNTPGSGTPSRYGFQAVALNSDDTQAGAWGALGTGKQKVPLSGRDYVEHSSPSMSGTFEMEWIAPAIGTGDVTFYSASNAVNFNGNSTGDAVASSTLTVTEAPSSNTNDLARELARLEVLPNPVGDVLNLKVTSRQSGPFNLRIIDVRGGVVQMQKIELAAGVNSEELSVSQLPTGLYILQLCGDGHLAATQMLKL